tara:strand:+ start:77 stop:208 length:132 start_codon:yes stop_codon:yes gene_type:complete
MNTNYFIEKLSWRVYELEKRISELEFEINPKKIKESIKEKVDD